MTARPLLPTAAARILRHITGFPKGLVDDARRYRPAGLAGERDARHAGD